jgi:hypothetical protein
MKEKRNIISSDVLLLEVSMHVAPEDCRPVVFVVLSVLFCMCEEKREERPSSNVYSEFGQTSSVWFQIFFSEFFCRKHNSSPFPSSSPPLDQIDIKM